MAKIELNTVSSGFFTNTLLNTNFTKIEDQMNNNILYRDNIGVEPNQVFQNIDLNSFKFFNASDAENASEYVTLRQAVGILEGGFEPGTVVQRRQRSVATTNQTAFDLFFNYFPGVNNLQVHRDGLLLDLGVDYIETDLNTVTLTTPSLGGEVLIFYSNNVTTDTGQVSSELVTYQATTVDAALDEVFVRLDDVEAVASQNTADIVVLQADVDQLELDVAQLQSDVSAIQDNLTTTIIVHDSIAAMVADSSLIFGSNVRTTGYIAASDRGNSLYETVLGGTGTADGGSFIDLDNGLQAKLIVQNPQLPVEIYGIGLGLGTDDVQFQRAINFATANSLEIILGFAYTFTSEMFLPANSHLRGDGTLTFNGPLTGPENSALRIDASNTTIENMTIIGNNVGTSTAGIISASGSANLDNTTIHNIIMTSDATSGSGITLITSDHGDDMIISNCKLDLLSTATDSNGILISTTTRSVGTTITDNFITIPSVSTTDTAMKIEFSSRVRISGNRIVGGYNAGISLINTIRGTVSDSYIEGVDNGYALQLLQSDSFSGSVFNMTVTGNSIRDSFRGISLAKGGSGALPFDCTIAGNAVVASDRALNVDAIQTVITGNKLTTTINNLGLRCAIVGLTDGASDLVFTGNDIKGTNTRGLALLSDAHCVVSGNIIVCGGIGIDVGSSSPSEVTIVGNYVVSTGDIGILQRSPAAGRVFIKSNTVDSGGAAGINTNSSTGGTSTIGGNTNIGAGNSLGGAPNTYDNF